MGYSFQAWHHRSTAICFEMSAQGAHSQGEPQMTTVVPRAAMMWAMNSGWPGQAAPVMSFPSVKHLEMGSGSSHSPPDTATRGFKAGYAVHFLPCETTHWDRGPHHPSY